MFNLIGKDIAMCVYMNYYTTQGDMVYFIVGDATRAPVLYFVPPSTSYYTYLFYSSSYY